MPPRVYRTRGGSAFHRTSTCAGLRDGQRYADRLGLTTHAIEAVDLNQARTHLAPCEVCFA